MSHPGPGGGAPAAGKVAWFHCFAGIAGDMALGSLIDAGADLSEVRALLDRLPLSGWDLSCEPVLRGGIACTRATVSVSFEDGRPGTATGRSHADIVALVTEAKLPERVTERALGAFAALARAEGRLHRVPPEDVHFHEVGGHDAVVDIVGTAAALEVLDCAEVAASAVAVGTGTLQAAHGVLPNPPPAVTALLAGVPCYGRDIAQELTTPTGAALLSALASSFGPMPEMTVTTTGFGAGSHELDELPNCTQVVVGTPSPGEQAGDGQPVTVLEANLDDVTGEQLALAVASLLDAGAHDAWVTPVVMKKGRPGHVLHALCDPARARTLRAVLRASTGSFGVRALSARRWPVARALDEVTVAGHRVRMKVGGARAKPEPDDVARAAALTGLPVHEVSSLAEEAWRHRPFGREPGG